MNVMAEETEVKDVYVYLDFQGKDTSRVLRQDNAYFRMWNLSENKPIVEIADEVYEGTYDDAIGTNLFFGEVPESSQNTDLFETPTPLTLKFLLKQTKILKLKKIGARQKILLNVPDTETVNVNIKDDYRILLEKFENNKLNIDEYVVEHDPQDEHDEVVAQQHIQGNQLKNDYKWELSRSPPRQNLTPDWYKSADNSLDQEQSKTSLTNPVSLKYIKLQKIAEQPSKRIIKPEVVDHAEVEQPNLSLRKSDFLIWKNLMMQKVELQTITVDVRKDKIEDFVDIEQSLKAGIISPSSESPRIFTKEEKSKLISFENFVNVSPLMKLIMLQDYEDMEKAAMDQMLPEELNEVGQDEYTPSERYGLIKTFKEELKNYLVARLREQYEYTGESSEKINLDVTLSDTDVTYSSSTSLSGDEDERGTKPMEVVLSSGSENEYA